MSNKNINKLFALEALKWRKIETGALDRQAILISVEKGNKRNIEGRHHLTSLASFIDYIIANIGDIAGKWGIKDENIVMPQATYLNFTGAGVTITPVAENLNIDIPADMTKAVYDQNDNGIVDEAEGLTGGDAAPPGYYYGTDPNTGDVGFWPIADQGQIIYDGIDTEANILALDPTASLGQVWWAFDTKLDYRAVSMIQAGDVWQRYSPPVLKLDRETWAMPTTPDGHSLDLGQETFLVGVNEGGVAATELDPKVFSITGVNDIDPTIKEFVMVLGNDMGEGSVFGINTVVADIGGLTKITTFGTISGVNTSAWSQNDVLYISNDVAGDLTNIKPIGGNQFVVGVVYAVHPTDGVIEVIASRGVDTAPIVIPAGFSTSFFTGDLAAAPAAIFLSALEDDQGTVPTANQTVVVNDGEKLGISQDWVTEQLVIDETLNAGTLTGQIEFEVNQTAGAKKLYIEVYKAAANGDVIDSGNGLPVGDRGVSPIVVLQSTITDPASGTIVNVRVQGISPAAVPMLIGERFRYHILCEKIGTQGGNITFTVYYGSDHLTLLAVPKLFELDDLVDVSITIPQDGDHLVYEASSGLWKNTPAGGGVSTLELLPQFDSNLDNIRTIYFFGAINFGNLVFRDSDLTQVEILTSTDGINFVSQGVMGTGGPVPAALNVFANAQASHWYIRYDATYVAAVIHASGLNTDYVRI